MLKEVFSSQRVQRVPADAMSLEGAAIGVEASPALKRAANPETSLLHNPCLREIARIYRKGEHAAFEDFSATVAKYGLGMLSKSAINLLRTVTRPVHGRISAIFSGLGYAEEQLAQHGFDVVACDIKLQQERFFREMVRSNYPRGCAEADRALFMSFPDRYEQKVAENAIRLYEKNGGSLVILVRPGIPATNRPCSHHPFGAEESLDDFLANYRRSAAVILPGWKSIPELHVWTRSGYQSLHPLLEVFEVGRKSPKRQGC